MKPYHHHHNGASSWMCCYYDTLCPISQFIRVCDCDWPLIRRADR